MLFLAKGQESFIFSFFFPFFFPFFFKLFTIFWSLIIQKELNGKTSSVIYISPWWKLECKNNFTYVEFNVFYVLGVNFSFWGRAPGSPNRQYHFCEAVGSCFANLRFHFWKIKRADPSSKGPSSWHRMFPVGLSLSYLLPQSGSLSLGSALIRSTQFHLTVASQSFRKNFTGCSVSETWLTLRLSKRRPMAPTSDGLKARSPMHREKGVFSRHIHSS